MLTAKDHQEIAAAIVAAEARTSGEIVCIVTDEVSKYREVPIAWGTAAALVLPPAFLLLGLHPWTAVSFASGWTEAPNLGEAVTQALAGYAIIQAALFATVAFLVAIPQVRRAATPRFLKQHRVKRTAYAHFASTGFAQSENRTGVLIFAALKDRQIQLLADDAIHHRVGDKAWDAAVAALVEGVKAKDHAAGFNRAIGICGEALAEHFPATGVHQAHGDGVVEV